MNRPQNSPQRVTRGGKIPIIVEVGGTSIAILTTDSFFREMLRQRYANFLVTNAKPQYQIEVELTGDSEVNRDESLKVTTLGEKWILARGDFSAEWDPVSGSGRIRQSANPYSLDAVLRIVHSLILARQGGFLVHAASVVRGGKAFLFAGISGAGKTTISRLAPSDAILLSDEISYLKPGGSGYRAWGTPFAGEMAKPGANITAPVAAIFFLEKGPENKIEEIPASEALHRTLRNVLFFANDRVLVGAIFQSSCALIESLPVRRLTFAPHQRVWDLVK